MIQSFTTNLMVENVDASAAFYKTTLNFDIIDSVPFDDNRTKFAILSDGTHTMMLEQRLEMAHEFPSMTTDTIKASVSLFVKIDSFDETVQGLINQGIIIEEQRETFYGTKEAIILDPDGYVLVLACQINES